MTTVQTKARRRDLVTIAQAADYLGVVPRTIRRRIADGTLAGYRVGPRAIRVDAGQLDELLHVIPTTGGSP